VFSAMLLTSEAQRTFVALQFKHPVTQKSLNLAKKLGKYWKMFNDKYMFDDGLFYLSSILFTG
jgi:hypothetical protein